MSNVFQQKTKFNFCHPSVISFVTFAILLFGFIESFSLLTRSKALEASRNAICIHAPFVFVVKIK